MSGRMTYTLGELYEVHNGLSKASKFFGSGYPFITFKDVFNNYFIPEVPSGLVQSTQKEQDSYSVKRGDILITRTSETHDELGMSSVALIDYPHATYNGFTKRLRPITDLVHPEFIGYYLRAPFFRSSFQQFSSMTTRASLKNEELLNMRVLLPSMEKQKRLASVLIAYDNLIENNRRQIALLEEAALRLYKEWFVDLRFPGHEDIETVDGIPSGWQIVQIRDVCKKIQSGGTPSRKKASFWNPGTVKWFKTGELQDCWLIEPEELISDDGLVGSAAKLFPPLTIVMAIYASPTLGRLGVLNCEAAFNQAMLGFIVNEDLTTRDWLYWKLFELRNEFNLIARGAGQQNISGEIVKSYEVLLPPRALAQKFSDVVRPMAEQRLKLQEQNLTVGEARERLLPKLMFGEIEV